MTGLVVWVVALASDNEALLIYGIPNGILAGAIVGYEVGLELRYDEPGDLVPALGPTPDGQGMDVGFGGRFSFGRGPKARKQDFLFEFAEATSRGFGVIYGCSRG